ncbi:MAG TPA: hypothetical protein VGA30_05020 [Actinomycetota bacterium]
MDAVAGAVRSPVRREAGKLLVPVGITVTLIAVIGDLVAHTLDPLAHEHEELVVLSARGNSPWHLLLFAGILVTAVGAIRWANHLGSDWGNLLGAAMVLLLVAAVGLGTWAGWQARTPSVTLASGAGSQAAGAHVHTAAADAVPANARAGEAGSGAEGASITGHVHGTPGSVSPQESQILSRQIAAAKSATAKYRSLAAAKADGYIQVTQFIPGLGLHLANLGISNRIFDPARPQVLLYQPDRSGKLVLVGVAYSIAHTGLDDPQPAGFAGNADVWHFHQDLCFLPTGSVTITPGAQPCRKMGGYFQAKTAWLLHAWIWKTNPDGLFTENNPSVF